MFFLRPIVMLLAVLFFTTAFAVPFVVTGAQARPEMADQATVTGRFAAMDTNKDGKVSPEEFFAAYPHMKEGAFAAIDTDRDGLLSLDEWLAFFKSHGRADSQAHSHDTEESRLACEEHSGSGGRKVPALILPPALKKQ